MIIPYLYTFILVEEVMPPVPITFYYKQHQMDGWAYNIALGRWGRHTA